MTTIEARQKTSWIIWMTLRKCELSSKELAEITGIGQASISRYVREIETPSVLNLLKIIEVWKQKRGKNEVLQYIENLMNNVFASYDNT